MARGALVLILSLQMGLSPIAHARQANAPALTAEQTLVAQENISVKLAGGDRLPKSLEGLRAKSKAAVALKAAAYVQREVLQISSTIIVLSAITFKAAADRNELQQLSAGTYKQKQDTSPDAPICGHRRDSGAAEDALCSGDFILGMLIGGGFAIGAGSVKVIDYFLRSSGKKIPFLNVALGLFSMPLMLSMAQAGSLLWVQATKYLNEEEQSRAQGLAGRAVLAYSAKKADEFNAGEDGKLFAKIGTIMGDIALVNQTFRDQWLFNVWRFGLARGEFIASIGTLMATGAIGESAGAGVAARLGLATAAGWSAAACGAILAGVFGIAGLYVVLNSSGPTGLTGMIQDSRQWLAGQRLAMNDSALHYIGERFLLVRHPKAKDSRHVDNVTKYALSTIHVRTGLRDDWANAGIEKYYEMRLEAEKLNQHIKMAEKVINDADLQKNLYFSENGEIISYYEVMKRLCPVPYTFPVGCRQPKEAYQLQALPKLRATLKEATALLPQLAEGIVDFYANEEKLADSLNSRTDVSMPYAVISQIDELEIRSQSMKKNFMTLFSVFSPALAEKWEIQWPTDAEKKKRMEVSVRGILDNYYSFGFSEAVVYEALSARIQ